MPKAGASAPKKEGPAWSSASFSYGLSAITILCGLLLLEVWRPAGLNTDYGIRLPGQSRLSISERRSRQLDFPRYEQLLTPYLESWRELKEGHPKGPPPMDIVWSGILAVRRPRIMLFGVDAIGFWTVRIGEETWDSSAASPQRTIALPAGDHPISIHYVATTSAARFRLSPRSAPLYPSSGFRDTIYWWRGSLLVSFLACLAALWFVFHRGSRRPLRHAAVVSLVVLGIFLRMQDRSAVPHHNATADEYYDIWAGRTLLTTGTPTSWSDNRSYRSGTIESWFDNSYRIVSPWFDQPPLFTLLVGIWGKLGTPYTFSPHFGGMWFLDGPPLGYHRILPIMLSAAALLLISDIGRRLYGWSVGVGAALLHATTPLLVPLNRLVKAENLVIVLALGVVATVLARRARPATWQLIAIGCLCAAAPLAKLTGVFVVPMALLLLWPRHEKSYGALFSVLAGGLAAALALLAYAAVMGWDLFWAVTVVQASKPSSLLSAAHLIYDPHLIMGPFGPGWVWWLWSAALPALVGRSKSLVPGLVTYVFVLAFSAHHLWLYGWYSIPIYAFLAVPASAALIRRRFPGVLLLFWLLYAGQSIVMVERLGLAWGRHVILVGALVVLLGEIASVGPAMRRDSRIAWGLILSVAVLNVILILNLPVLWTEENHNHFEEAWD